jgi:hypothetical protein
VLPFTPTAPTRSPAWMAFLAPPGNAAPVPRGRQLLQGVPGPRQSSAKDRCASRWATTRVAQS